MKTFISLPQIKLRVDKGRILGIKQQFRLLDKILKGEKSVIPFQQVEKLRFDIFK